MSVWIVEMGEDHEGGSIDGVYGSHDAAIKRATVIRGDKSLGPWTKSKHTPDVWHRGCDWLSIGEFEVVT